MGKFELSLSSQPPLHYEAAQQQPLHGVEIMLKENTTLWIVYGILLFVHWIHSVRDPRRLQQEFSLSCTVRGLSRVGYAQNDNGGSQP